MPAKLTVELPYISEKDFSYLLETDASKRDAGRYLPTRGLGKNWCNALGWVIADAYEFWPDQALANDQFFHEKRRQISDFINKGIPQPAEIFFDVKAHLAEEITRASRDDIASESLQAAFLRGDARPALGIVNADATIERDCENDVLKAIRDGTQRVILLTSAAGDGKSTLMYRLAQHLFDEDWRVLFKHERLFDADPTWPLGQDERTNTALFIDRAEGLRDLQSLYVWAGTNPKLRVILAAREIDWTQHGHPLDSPHHRHMPVSRLMDREIDDLAALMLKCGVADPPASLDELRKRLRHSIHETEYRTCLQQ